MNPYAKYEDNSINTASREELTLMLYDGAMKFLNQSISAVEAKDFDKANELNQRVQDIIREFQITLDHKYEVSGQLNSLYDYIVRKLVEGNMTKDLEALSEAREMIRELRDTWKEAMKIAKKDLVNV
jgi:flagellar protein FliS